MQDIARSGQMQQNQAAARAVGAGAFGGSREGIERAEIGRNILDQQARTASTLRQQGFNQAQQQQFARAQGAASGLGSLGMQQAKLGEAFQGMNINDLNTLAAMGGQEQQQRQWQLEAAIQEAIIFGNRYRELQEHGLDPLRLIKPKGGDPVAPPVNKIEALKSGSMHCAGCGAHLESDLNFCPACGQEK